MNHVKKCIFPIVIVLLFTTIFFAFPLNIHTWESYFFSEMVLDQVSLAELLSFQNPSLEQYFKTFNALSYFHPTHWPFHFLIKSLHVATLEKISPLFITTCLNKIFAILTLIVFYKTLLILNQKKLESFLLTLVYGFSSLFWYQAISGEVYVLPIFFIHLSILFLIKHFSIQIQNKHHIIISILFALIATFFHLLAGVYLFILVVALLALHKKTVTRKILLISTLTSIVFSLFYFLPFLILWFGNTSLLQIFKLPILYSQVLGQETSMIAGLATGAQYFGMSIVSSNSWIIITLNLLLVIALTVFFLIKNGRTKSLFFFVNFFLYFLVIVIVIKIPSVVDYWFFPFVFFMISAAFFLEKVKRTSFVLIVVPILIYALIGSFNHIEPQIFPDELASISIEKEKLAADAPVVFISKEPYNNLFFQQVARFRVSNNIRQSLYVLNINNPVQVARLKIIIDKANGIILTDFSQSEFKRFLHEKNLVHFVKHIQTVPITLMKESHKKSVGVAVKNEALTLFIYQVSRLDEYEPHGTLTPKENTF